MWLCTGDASLSPASVLTNAQTFVNVDALVAACSFFTETVQDSTSVASRLAFAPASHAECLNRISDHAVR